MSDQLNDRYVAGEPGWRDIEIDPPPRGSKVVLLTWEGIQCIGAFEYDNGKPLYAAWQPLTPVPDWLKKRIKARRHAGFAR